MRAVPAKNSTHWMGQTSCKPLLPRAVHYSSRCPPSAPRQRAHLSSSKRSKKSGAPLQPQMTLEAKDKQAVMNLQEPLGILAAGQAVMNLSFCPLQRASSILRLSSVEFQLLQGRHNRPFVFSSIQLRHSLFHLHQARSDFWSTTTTVTHLETCSTSSVCPAIWISCFSFPFSSRLETAAN